MPKQFSQTRFYDFNVRSREKVREKLDYMHANPVQNKLAGGSPFMLEDALGGLPLRVWVLQGWDILRFASLLLCVSPPLISPRDRCQSILAGGCLFDGR
jgi:L-lysine 2,3-aminomutase